MDNIIETLQKFGLTEYEIKLYMTLLQRESCTAGELSQASGVPRPKTYEILTSLCNKGLCAEIPENIKQYTAISPDIAIYSIKQKINQEMNQKIEMLNSVENLLLDIYSNRSVSENNGSVVQIIRDKHAIWQSIQELINNAKEEILVFSKEPFIVSVGKSGKSMSQISKDVRVRSIYEEKDVNRKDYKEGIKTFLKEGEEAKVASQLPVKMTIIDNQLVLLIINEKHNAANDIIAIIIKQTDLANTFKIIFEFFWMGSQDISQYLENQAGNTV